MTPHIDLSEPTDTATDRPPPGPGDTWIVDLAHSGLALTWGRRPQRTVTGRLHCLGIIHLDNLPPVGAIRFQQPSGLPVLTMALDPASVDTGDARLDTLLCGPGGFDAMRHRWWTLRSESLEILPTGAWRVMATLTARGTPALVELHVQPDPEASDHHHLVLRGQGVLDRRTFGLGAPPPIRRPRVRIDLELQATRVTRDWSGHDSWRQSSEQNGSSSPHSVTASSAAARIAAPSTSRRDAVIPRPGHVQTKATGPGGGRGRTR